jgi:heme/copper-type cytochrome/quinol oxidase subunit 2
MKKRKVRKGNRSKLERKLDEVNHTMELIRTVIPIIILVVQIIILIKLFS